MSTSHGDPPQSVLQPVTLPSGQVMSNGLVKVAMYEHMARFSGGLPNADHFALYDLWSKGGWGMIMTGNVQVSNNHLALGRDMVLPETITQNTLRSYQLLACCMRPAPSLEQNLSENQDVSTPRTLIIMQVSHAGRQSPAVLGGRALSLPPLAPSAIAVGRSAPSGWLGRLLYKFLFPTPRTMNLRDIDYVVDRFVFGAKLAHKAYFDGIELHASHGYLLAQFISPQTNIRDDAYSANRAPLYLLRRIVTSIREVLPRPFVLGIKLNSSDYIGAGSAHDSRAEEEAEDRAVAHVVDIALWDMIDFIEISGGDYENPGFLSTGRQAFYSRFARKARSAIHVLTSPSRPPLVLLTGGMRSPATFQDALSQGHADLIGIGRGSVLAPNLPVLLEEFCSRQQAGTPDDRDDDNKVMMGQDFPVQQPTLSYAETPPMRIVVSVLRLLGILPLPSLVGAGAVTAWYILAMRRISRGQRINYHMGGIRASLLMWVPELRVRPILLSCCITCCTSIYVWSRAWQQPTIVSYGVPTLLCLLVALSLRPFT